MGYEYKALNRGTGKRIFKSIRSLVLDSVAYSFTFTPAVAQQDTTGLGGAEQRSKFFNSLAVQP